MREIAAVFDYEIATARVLARIYTQRRDLCEEVNGQKKAAMLDRYKAAYLYFGGVL